MIFKVSGYSDNMLDLSELFEPTLTFTVYRISGMVLSSFGFTLTFKRFEWKRHRLPGMKTTTDGSKTHNLTDSWTKHWTTPATNSGHTRRRRHWLHEWVSLFSESDAGFHLHRLPDTHSDPDESPSTVPALMLRATPFSWSGKLRLAEAARLSLEEDPWGDAVPGAFSHSSLLMRLKLFLSTMGESCFFFRIPGPG